jgi:AbrB family looped-hinge helix DNA binding protein
MIEISIGSVTSKGQVTIPKDIRDELGLTEGDKIMFLIEGDKAILRKVTGEKLSTILEQQKNWTTESMEYQRRIREEWQRR